MPYNRVQFSGVALSSPRGSLHASVNFFNLPLIDREIWSLRVCPSEGQTVQKRPYWEIFQKRGSLILLGFPSFARGFKSLLLHHFPSKLGFLDLLPVGGAKRG